jgi:hypothetical protein
VAPVACCIQVDFGSSMSYNFYIPRHTEEEYQRYTPNENRRVETVRKVTSFFVIGWIGGLALLIGLSYAGFTPDNVIPPWVIVGSLGFSFAVSMIGFVAWQAMLAGRDGAVDDALVKERDALNTQVAKMQNDIKRVAAKIKDIKAKGNVVMAGAGAIVNVDSVVSNSFNAIQHDDPALAEALATIAGAVEQSGNKEAGQAWDSFMKQVAGERDKTILSALWDKVVKLVPDIASLAESAAKIAPLFIAGNS